MAHSTFLTERKSLLKPVSVSGRGVHSSNICNLSLNPASSGTGIVFVRKDLEGHPSIAANLSHIEEDKMMRRTTLRSGGVSVFTIEHVVSALTAYGVSDCIIEMDQEEPPFLDGSSLEFCKLIESAQIEPLGTSWNGIRILRPLLYRTNDAEISVLPSEDFQITFFYNSHHPGLKAQSQSVVVNDRSYKTEIAPARTFCFFEEIEMMRKANLIRGANLSSAVVIGRKSIINNDLRFTDEPARHKILDFIGDIALLGFPLKGHFLVWKGGHKVNADFGKYLIKELGL